MTALATACLLLLLPDALQEKKLQLYSFEGVKEREWVLESVIRYIKVGTSRYCPPLLLLLPTCTCYRSTAYAHLLLPTACTCCCLRTLAIAPHPPPPTHTHTCPPTLHTHTSQTHCPLPPTHKHTNTCLPPHTCTSHTADSVPLPPHLPPACRWLAAPPVVRVRGPLNLIRRNRLAARKP